MNFYIAWSEKNSCPTNDLLYLTCSALTTFSNFMKYKL